MKIKIFLVLTTLFRLAKGQDWSACSTFCGGGTKTAKIPCMFEPGCTRYVNASCNTQPCAPKTFNTYTPCTRSCGGGHRFKVPPCFMGHTDLCDKIYEECNTANCPELPACPPDTVFRYRDKSACCEKSTETCGVPNTAISGAALTVIGGEGSKVGQWPWMAVIVKKNSKTTLCSGSLIHKDYVLTAAHCIDTRFLDPSKFYVQLGATKIRYPEVTKKKFEIEKLIPHELHDGLKQLHNIGLVKLKTSAIFNHFVKPICLPNGEAISLDIKCVAAGWGVARKEDMRTGTTSDTLQHVSLQHLPEDACVEGLKKISKRIRYFNSSENVCFGNLSGGKDTCAGDSGGPVMCQRCSSCGWFVAGTLSYGSQSCATFEVPPSVYTNVKAYESWIGSKISDGLSKTPLCSKTCGGGHYYIKKCKENKCNDCEKTYKECNMHECQPQSCPANQIHKFDDNSTCCIKSKEDCGVVSSKFQSRTRIIGGTKSKQLQWPWLAVIVKKTALTAICGGSLIHKDWVLTAAHCIVSKNKEKLHILLGSTSIIYPKATKQIIQIEKFIIHEHYSEPINDIGLIKLKKSANYTSFVKPICLPHGERITIDMKCVAAGWGIAQFEDIKSKIPSDVLQHVVLRNLPHDACRSGLTRPGSWEITYYNDEKNVCFGKLSGGKDTCQGDSGGPIMCQRCSSCGWYVAGITSFGPIRCGEVAGQPSVYVYVRAYESWIRQRIYGSTSFESFSC